MAPKPLPSRELVRQLLSYEPDSGAFTWLHRPREMFGSTEKFGSWNTKFAGKRAGSHRSCGYFSITVFAERYLSHRLAWLWVYGEPVPPEIDHIDTDPSNNRIANLRSATHSQNVANARMFTTNTTGIKGVYLFQGRFRAEIIANGTRYSLGSFATLGEASEARRKAASRLQGEFARHE